MLESPLTTNRPASLALLMSESNQAATRTDRAGLTPAAADEIVADSVVPHGTLPPLRYRDLPPPVPIWRMLGPSVILAGMALGSGEFVIWPYLTYKTGFGFFWACLVGVTLQYFINMEITRWSLATGESAMTGFCRLARGWAAVFLLLNVVPWMIPAWAKGAAQIVSWLIWGATLDEAGHVTSPYVTELAMAGLVLCGLILTAGPVLYNTVERIQMLLVTSIVGIVIVLALLLVRGDALAAMAAGAVAFEIPATSADVSVAMLLGALAFAGAGGTLNLGQSNYVKDKGYGMGRYVGRITSPITGQEEPIVEIGYFFPDTPENRRRWRHWWWAAGWEHLISFWLTCVVCLVLLTLMSYSIFHRADGMLDAQASADLKDMAFIWGEAREIGARLGPPAELLFLVMGVAILLTTEFGVLDATSRISTDIVKVNWLRENTRWGESRLYYLFLWLTIGLGIAILWIGTERVQGSLVLFELTSAMNGGVMFLYCGTLLWLNSRSLPVGVRMAWWRRVILASAVLFFGCFAVWAAADVLGLIGRA